jgi:hypothetical protein
MFDIIFWLQMAIIILVSIIAFFVLMAVIIDIAITFLGSIFKIFGL